MRVVSLSVGLPREVEWDGHTVLTSIFKAPVNRRLRVTTLNFEGDEQSDLTVHGGVDKAVYAYPSEHYAYWRHELPGMDLPWAVFGENLTTEGLLEADVRIGDRFRVGSAEFIVTQPRMPCYKLGIRFGRMDILKRFLKSGRTGFYFAVTTEGEVGAGDPIEPIASGRGLDRLRRRQPLHGRRGEPGASQTRDPVGHPPRELARLLPQAALGSRRLSGTRRYCTWENRPPRPSAMVGCVKTMSRTVV